MKPRIYILSILFVLAMMFTLTAKADDHGNNNCNNNNNSNNNKSCGNGGSSTTLPIDSGIAFLAVAGTAIGIFAVKKSRSASKMVAIKS